MKTTNKEPVTENKSPKGGEHQGHPEIKSDYPLSEKDEVKNAEDKLRKGSQVKKTL